MVRNAVQKTSVKKQAGKLYLLRRWKKHLSGFFMFKLKKKGRQHLSENALIAFSL